jgi:hypothetical protein
MITAESVTAAPKEPASPERNDCAPVNGKVQCETQLEAQLPPVSKTGERVVMGGIFFIIAVMVFILMRLMYQVPKDSGK